MSKPILATFIGGPWDLHRVALHDAPPRFTVPVLDNQEPMTFGQETTPEEIRVRHHSYRRHNLFGAQGDVLVYLSD